MNWKKFLLAFLAAGVIMNIFDALVHGMLMKGMYEELPGLFRQDTPIAWFVALDFIFALVLTFVYAKVHASFAPGVAGGALFGFYAGVLVCFPNFLAMRLMIVDFPYGMAWMWTVAGIVWYIIAGMIIAGIYRSKAPVTA